LPNRIYSLCVAPTNLICRETFFSIIFQMDTHLFFTQKTYFQVLCKWVPVYLLCSWTFLLKFFANWHLCLFFKVLCETTSCRSNSWTNQIYSKLHKINPSLKFHQELFFSNKSIANQPNWFKSTKFEALVWNQPCLGSFMEVF